jgi:hypothetical protein
LGLPETGLAIIPGYLLYFVICSYLPGTTCSFFFFFFDCKFACSMEKKRTSIVLYKYMQPWMHSISSTYCRSNSVLQLSFSCLLLMKNCTWNGLLIYKNLTFFVVLEAFLSFIGN